MTTGPEDARTAAGRVHRGASQADHEGVIEALKAAFVAGRLTEEEFEAWVGQAFAARSRADLAAITADIPVGPAGPAAARPARMPDRVVAGGTGVIIAAAALGGAVLIGGSALILWAITMAGVLLFTVSLLLAVRQERRTRGRRPPRSALAGPSGPTLEGPLLEGESPGHDYYAFRSYLPRIGGDDSALVLLAARGRGRASGAECRRGQENADGRPPGQAHAVRSRAGTMTLRARGSHAPWPAWAAPGVGAHRVITSLSASRTRS